MSFGDQECPKCGYETYGCKCSNCLKRDAIAFLRCIYDGKYQYFPNYEGDIETPSYYDKIEEFFEENDLDLTPSKTQHGEV